MTRRLLALVLIVAVAGTARAEAPSVAWQKWDPALFERAQREDKYILLHMAAVWCHWCHVMESTTYRDPAIRQRIAEKFIPVRVDQDSYRYENWGWPATIMLDKDGNEIFKRRGYIPPELFAKLLVAVIEDPSALPSYTVGAEVDPHAVSLTAERRERTEALLLKSYDVGDTTIAQLDVEYERLDGKSVTVPNADVLIFDGDLVKNWQIYIDLAPVFAP